MGEANNSVDLRFASSYCRSYSILALGGDDDFASTTEELILTFSSFTLSLYNYSHLLLEQINSTKEQKVVMSFYLIFSHENTSHIMESHKNYYQVIGMGILKEISGRR